MKISQLQMELFPRDDSESLFPYWWESLAAWPRDVFRFRHWPGTTGWSMATGGFIFAELLYLHGQMPKGEFRRWFRFNRRVKRWGIRGAR